MYRFFRSDWVQALGFALATALFSAFSLSWLAIPAGDSGLWLAGSLGLAVLLLHKPGYWPALLLGTLAGYLAVRGWNSPLQLLAYTCNALAPLAAAVLCRRLQQRRGLFDHRLRSLRDFMLLGLAAGAGAAVAAISASLLLWLGGLTHQGAFLLDALHWWMGTFLGIVLFVPVFLVWQERSRRFAGSWRIAEAVLCAALALLCGQIVFLGWFGNSFGPYIHDEWMFIFAVWAAVRFGRHGMALMVALAALQGGLGIAQGYGMRDATVLDLAYIDYWIYMAVYSLVGSALATVVSHLEHTRADLDHDRTLLRGVMDSIPDLIFFKDSRSTYLGCNKAFARMYGTNEYAIVGKTDLDLVDAERAESYRSEDAQMLVDGQQRFIEESIPFPGGGRRLMEKLKTPYFDAEGRVRGIIGVLRDITRRDLSERREKLANQMLRHLTSQQPMLQTLEAMLVLLEQDAPQLRASILLLDEDEQHVLLGSAPSMPASWRRAVDGMPVGDETFPCTIAACTGDLCVCNDTQQHASARYRAVAAQAEVRACWTEPIKSHGGSLLGVLSFHLAEPGSPGEDDRQLLKLVANLAAIAIERGRMERSEQTYRALSHTLETLLNALPIQVALIDENGAIVRTNRLWKKFHVEHPAAVDIMDEGDNLLDRFPRVAGQSGKPVRVASGVQSVLRGASAQYVCEIQLQRDERLYWYQLAVVPVPAPDNAARAGAVVMLTDITQSRKTQEELNLREQEFKALAENAPDMVLRLDIDGRFLYANPAVASAAGLAADAIVGRSVDQVWDDAAVASEWLRAIFTLFNTESTRELIEFDLQREDARRYYQAYLVPEYGSGRRSVMSVLAVIRDISELKRAQAHLLESQEQLREMARSSAMLIERERKFIASELHDELGQLLTVLRMEVSMLKLTYGAGRPALQDKADEMTGLIDNCIQGMRKAIAHMRPMALDLGLVPALEWLCDDFSRRHDIPCALHGLDDIDDACADKHCTSRGESCVRDADGGIRLDDDRAIVVFRIVQESLTNIARHAQASRVEITLSCDGCRFRVRVCDNGHGFDPAQVDGSGHKRFGLLGMQERAFSLGGRLEVISHPGAGTTVALSIPNTADADGCAEYMEETT